MSYVNMSYVMTQNHKLIALCCFYLLGSFFDFSVALGMKYSHTFSFVV